MTLLLAPSSRMAFSAWLHSTLPSMIFGEEGAAQATGTGALEAELMALVAAATDAEELRQSLVTELRDFRANAGGAEIVTTERAAHFSAEVMRWMQQQPPAQPDAAVASSSAAAAAAASSAPASDEAMPDSQESADSFSILDSSSRPLASTPRSGRKRRERESDDDSERGEAEGAISGSDSKRRREQGALSSPSTLYGGKRACFEYNRTSRCSRGHSCHFAHTNGSSTAAALSMPAAAASSRPGSALSYLQSPSPYSAALSYFQSSPQLIHSSSFPIARSMSEQPLSSGAARPPPSPSALQRTSSSGSSASAVSAVAAAAAPAVSSAAAIAASTSCKLCASFLPESLYSLPVLTSWFGSFGDLVSLRLMPPDRCVVTFVDHESAQRAFDAPPPIPPVSQNAASLNQPLAPLAVKMQWIVPKGTNSGAAAATAAAMAAAMASGAEERQTSDGCVTHVVDTFESRSGKAITVKRKVHLPPPPSSPSSSLSSSGAVPAVSAVAIAAALTVHGKSNSMPLLPLPLVGAGVSPVAASAAAASSSHHHARSSSNAGLNESALRSLLAQTEGVLSKLAMASAASGTDNEPMQRSLRTKIAALKAELMLRGSNSDNAENSTHQGESNNAAFAAPATPAAAAAASSAPRIFALPLAATATIHSLLHQAPAFASPTRTLSASSLHSPLSAPSSGSNSGSDVVDQLRAQKESALRVANAQSRAAQNKQRLDEEMDAMRKNAQLATIHEM